MVSKIRPYKETLLSYTLYLRRAIMESIADNGGRSDNKRVFLWDFNLSGISRWTSPIAGHYT